MNMYNSINSRNCVLNEQIARQVFSILPEDGPIMVIMDRDGHVWPSDSERFAKLNPDEAVLRHICGKIDDGAEPVVSQIGDYSIVASQLCTDNNNCGYVIIALRKTPGAPGGEALGLPQSGPESTLANMDLIEILLNEVGLIAKLIEKNNHLCKPQEPQAGETMELYENQVNQYRAQPQTLVASN